MRVASVQFKGDRERMSARRGELADLVRSVHRGTSLVVCPELAVSGYVFAGEPEARVVAESLNGPTFSALSAAAREVGAWVVCGFVEDAGEQLFNSAMIIDPGGELASCYRKTLLFELDECWSHPGDSGYQVFDMAEGRFGVGICMDLNDDRFTSWVREQRLAALAFPTNWLEQGIDVWGYWAMRLSGSQTALVAANTYGDEGSTTFSGRSAVLQEKAGRWYLHAHADVVGDALVEAQIQV
ncbi:MAG: putative amidohydrolase [Kiritimatiellia bacterium]|jgi:predicted amidohydrolase